MESLKIFENPIFGTIRTIVKDGKVWFCGSDVAKALGYANPRDAVCRHCRRDGVVKHEGVSLTTNQHGITTEQFNEIKYIDEGNVYRLTAHSKLPIAEQFECWLFDDVLPSIRKHGMYVVDDLLEDPDLAIKAFTALKEERAERAKLEKQIEQDKPKILFADAVAVSKTTILVGELAKILKQSGVTMGQNRLFEWLRNQGYLIVHKGTDYNMPTQKSMEMGLFEIKETVIAHSDGHSSVSKTTKVTGRGQQYFISKFLEQ